MISVVPEPKVTPLITASQTAVGANTLTTITTLTGNGARNISRISCSGMEYAKFQIFTNSTLRETRRGGPNRTVDFVFDPELYLAPGDVLDVKVTHYVTGETPDFEATIYGY